MPDVKFTGISKGQRLGCTSEFYWCGTEKSKLEPGRSAIQITLVSDLVERPVSKLYFHLEFKK